jgi:lipooligosaccharide transport system permease protein
MTARPVPGSVRAALLVMEGHWTWYKRNWRATAISSVVSPLLTLVAMGLGFGSQVRPGPATDGVGYLQFLAPAMLVSAAVQLGISESTYPVLGQFKWVGSYWAIVSAPITARQVAGAQVTWICLRVLFSSVVFALIALPLGALTAAGAVWSVVFSALAGTACAAPVVAYAASLNSEGQQFNGLFRFVVMPMTLFAGTFFSVSQLPVWLRPLAWLTPMWHGTELARGAALGGLRLLPALGHVGYLAALLAVGVVLARRQFDRRLMV